MIASEGGPGLAIEVSGVTKRYGSRAVVNDLSFTVTPGRVTGFLGPNGAGKSTTMKVLLGLADPDAGTATIGGKRYHHLDDPVRIVGALLEHEAFHPGRSGRNHLLILAEVAGIGRDRVDEVLTLVGLGDAADRRAGAYSLGMKQRLGLAASLLGDPPVLVLDEPGNGLDPDGIRTLRNLLRARAALGHTILVSSHLLGEVELLADDVVMLNKGRLVRSGPLRELQQATALVRSPALREVAEVLERAGGITHPDSSGALVVKGLSLDAIGEAAFEAGIPLHELSTSAGSLEELFLGWTVEPDQTVTEEATR